MFDLCFQVRQDNSYIEYMDFIKYLKKLKSNIVHLKRSFHKKKCISEISKLIERLFGQCREKFPYEIAIYLYHMQYLYNINQYHKCSTILSQALKFWPEDGRLKELTNALLIELNDERVAKL